MVFSKRGTNYINQYARNVFCLSYVEISETWRKFILKHDYFLSIWIRRKFILGQDVSNFKIKIWIDIGLSGFSQGFWFKSTKNFIYGAVFAYELNSAQKFVLIYAAPRNLFAKFKLYSSNPSLTINCHNLSLKRNHFFFNYAVRLWIIIHINIISNRIIPKGGGRGPDPTPTPLNQLVHTSCKCILKKI